MGEFLLARSVKGGFALLDQAAAQIQGLHSLNPAAISLALCLAQWVDLGYGGADLLEAIMRRLARPSPEMPFVDVMRLHLLDAFCHLAAENVDGAISSLERVGAGTDMLPPPLIFLTHFWRGRTHRKKGDYANAAQYIGEARRCAEQFGFTKLVAVTKIHESWLVSQDGDTSRALRLLDEAETELTPIGHALSLGNIELARGRFVRRSGNYAESLIHFD